MWDDRRRSSFDQPLASRSCGRPQGLRRAVLQQGESDKAWNFHLRSGDSNVAARNKSLLEIP